MKNSLIDFQEDMVREILFRLPLKSLIQVMCVCKSWYRFISSSTFITATISNTNNSYLLTTYKDFYSLNRVDGVRDTNKLYYTPELFGVDENISSGVKIYGTCNGSLCVSDTLLQLSSIIYLCNPFIRKVKRIPMIPIEVHEPMEDAELFFGYHDDAAALSFGYFDDDYKVIRIAEFFGMYRIGVYSLSTDSWKIIYCESDYGTFILNSEKFEPSSKCVNGVACFIKYKGRLVCFDLRNERIREVDFPENYDMYCSILEAYGESIALMGTSHEHLVKWELKYCGATNTSTWEKKVIVELHSGLRLYSIGFLIDGTYLLRGYGHGYLNDFYVCDLDTSRLEKYTGEMVSDEPLAINYLTENLVLLHEEMLDPIAETEPYSSTQWNQIVLRRGRIERNPSFN